MRNRARIIGALTRRALNEILRVPAGAIPGIMAPAIFLIGLSAAFGNAAHLPGFARGLGPHAGTGVDAFRSYILPVSLLQGAGFTGAATGVNLARDMEQGWFDRLLLAPVARTTLLGGIVLSAALRALLPATFLVAVGIAIGVHWPGVGALAIAYVLVAGMAVVTCCYATIVALRFRTQQAAPLMQAATFFSVLATTAYAPQALLTGWVRTVARYNPVTKVLEGARQGFVGSGITWHTTWPAFAAILGMTLVFGFLALRSLARSGR